MHQYLIIYNCDVFGWHGTQLRVDNYIVQDNYCLAAVSRVRGATYLFNN